ncbi:MAG: GNAT family N-acetyltransferase [Candidatus Azobacteroides sp.]|nr:GNAT family N-acetyltransferase [Candidatus Azobacteroides sp.]
MLENTTLKLRALEPEDLDILYRWENDITLWHEGNTLTPWSKYSLRKYIEESFQDLYEIRRLRLMIIKKENNRAVGTVDLFDFDPFHNRAEVGILVDREYQKQGIAEQTLNLLKEYAFHFLKIKQIYAYIPENNEISLRLFRRCNYVIAGKLSAWIKSGNEYRDVYILQLLRD